MSKAIEAVGMGKIDGNSHPVHPATVHFPLTFLCFAYALDTLYGLATARETSSTVAKICDVTPYLSDISRFSHICNVLGIITSVPAVLSGGVELYAMIRGNGIWESIKRESDGKEVYRGMVPKVRHGILHALLNDVALMASVYNWWTRKDRAAFAPDGTNIMLSMMLLPGVFFSAYLGGAMIYKYGVAVMRQGEAVQIKKDMQKDEVKKRDGMTTYKIRKE